MKQSYAHIKWSKRLRYYFLLATILFASFCFISIEIAALAGVLMFTILVTRKIIMDYNPGFVIGYQIIYDQKKVDIPKGVDVLDISKLPSINHLYSYAEIIRGLLFPPSTLIIRFCGIVEMGLYEVQTIKVVLQKLHSSGIVVILADVERSLNTQFRQFEIINEVGIENVFNDISEAIIKINTGLN